jgi:hypothetical protein
MAALLDACRHRLASPDLLARESAAARLRAERMFALDEVMRRVLEVYRKAVDGVSLDNERGADR